MPNPEKTVPALTPEVAKVLGEKEKEVMTHRKTLILEILKERPGMSPRDAAIMCDGGEVTNKGWLGCC